MGLESRADGSESRFIAYVEAITSTLGHADRASPFRSYCAGLLLPGDRKSVEPMAARMQPGRVQAAHQSLHHFVAKSDWSDDAVLAAVRARVLPIIERRGRIRALIIDDTGMPKKGKHSVGVARQYCGQLGKHDSWQVALSPSAANDHASLPIAYRLYLTHEWADDPVRRRQGGVPDDLVFQTKPQIALDQLQAALASGIDAEVALLDAGYGNDTDLRDGITEMGLPYVVGIQSSTSLRSRRRRSYHSDRTVNELAPLTPGGTRADDTLPSRLRDCRIPGLVRHLDHRDDLWPDRRSRTNQDAIVHLH